jgi:transcriptional regulator with XRE-family HTH domain
MPLKENLKKFRDLKGWTQQELADAAGVSQQTIADVESGRTKRPRELHLIADALGIDLRQLIPEIKNPRVVEQIARPMYGDRDLPVYASVEGGEGAILVHFEPVTFEARPAPLIGVRDAYAVYVVGDSMSPAYGPGDMALVNPHLPAVPQRTYIFYCVESDGTQRATIKKLIKATATHWHVEQYNPVKSFTLARKEWQQCHKVVGKYEP